MTTTIFCQLCFCLSVSEEKGTLTGLQTDLISKLTVVTILIFNYDKLTVKTNKFQLSFIAELFKILLISLKSLCIVGLLWTKNKYLLDRKCGPAGSRWRWCFSNYKNTKIQQQNLQTQQNKNSTTMTPSQKIKLNVKKFTILSAFTWIGSLLLFFMLY